jgi:hypothetical protein
MHPIEIGKQYGLLTVLKKVESKSGSRYVLVRCSCVNATEKEIRFAHLCSGHTTSCGCEQKTATKIANTTHGFKKHRLYKIWAAMMYRCNSPKSQNYASYGGRGITVCESWKKVENFINDMDATWEKGLTIDRIDNEQGYFLENCHWATMKEQNSNKRTNVYATLNGKTQCLSKWCEELNLKYSTVKMRIKAGKTPEQALI